MKIMGFELNGQECHGRCTLTAALLSHKLWNSGRSLELREILFALQKVECVASAIQTAMAMVLKCCVAAVVAANVPRVILSAIASKRVLLYVCSVGNLA
mmetsp:Transcript_8011/g.8778  ORF Transcript_8011/g.8778 Transcript_8011/m.8778 type:complete len:99 (-) Transcript_8011:80-376(-)